MQNPVKILCDNCENPINPATGYIDLNPVRGGFTFVVSTGPGLRHEERVTRDINLCGPDCLQGYVAGLVKKIKPPEAAKVTSAK